jgi:glycosyltransferase involved in cell wall biosynthesis
MIRKKKNLCIMQLPPPVHGAAVMNSYVQKSALLSATFELDVLELHYVRKLADFRSAYLKKLCLLIKYWFILLYKLSFNRPDLVYFTITPYGASFYRDLLMVALIKIFRIKKMVYHLHGKGIKDCYHHQKRWYNYAYHNVDVICLGNKLKEDIHFFKGTPYIVNNGIPIVNHVLSKQKKSEIDGIVRILYLSNFVKSKGVLDLLEAAKRLKSRKVTFKIQLIGAFHGQITKDFFNEYLQNNDLLNQIDVIGPIYGDAKNQYFIDSDIFVFPSYYKNEAMPLVLIEAMQYGLPCISTFEGCIPEIIEENITGLLFRQRDIEDFANKLELLIKNKEFRGQMGKKGKERFYQFFTLEKFEQNLCNTFTSILDK